MNGHASVDRQSELGALALAVCFIGYFLIILIGALAIGLGGEMTAERLTYAIRLSLVCLAGAWCARRFGQRPVARTLLYVLSLTLLVELSAAVSHRALTGLPFLQPPPVPEAMYSRFTYHPMLVGTPRPNFDFVWRGIHYSHNSKGLRGPESAVAVRGITIALVGGSTTYDVGVSTDQTWAAHLQSRLGDAYRVINYGVPGHSTVEHIATTALQLPDESPSCVVFYLGWNDLRNAHLADLTGDYRNFHLLAQFDNLALRPQIIQRFGLASLSLADLLGRRLAQTLWPDLAIPHAVVKGTVSADMDPRLMTIWQQHLTTLAKVTTSIGATPIFVPQVLNWGRFTSDRPSSWSPLVPDRAVPELMGRLNTAMLALAGTLGVPTVPEVLAVAWDDQDFVDNGHFSPRGTVKFAEALSPTIERTCKAAPVVPASGAP